MNEDLVTTEELTANELATSVSEKGTIADGSALDPGGAPQPMTSEAAVTAVDTLHISQNSELGVRTYLKSMQGTLDHFLQRV